jgi:predicted DNA-binding protein
MTKKIAKKIAAKDADQYMLRLPPGLRDRVARRAAENGRSMNTEIVEAIEKYLEGADRMTHLWEFVEKHRENVEALDRILDAVEYLESRVEKIDGEGSGVLTDWGYKKEEEDRRRREKRPPE